MTADNTDKSDLIEIKQLYIQNGKTIAEPPSNITSLKSQYDSITDRMCADVKTAMGDPNIFSKKGGLKSLSDALARHMTLTLSIEDDPDRHMLWLDSRYPVDSQKEGALRGPCATSSGVPADL